MDKMLSGMTSEQLDELMAADEIDQIIGLEKLYQILSLIGCTIANSWGGTARPSDFIPRSPAEIRMSARRTPTDPDTQNVSPNQMATIVSLAFPQQQ